MGPGLRARPSRRHDSVPRCSACCRPTVGVGGVADRRALRTTFPHVYCARSRCSMSSCSRRLQARCGRSLAASMQWSRAAAWAGFVALFGSFAIAKHATYYPALTDPTAFALGMAMIWAYLTIARSRCGSVAALGVVTWPALPPLALAMLVFPRARWPRSMRRSIAGSRSGSAVRPRRRSWSSGSTYLAHPMPRPRRRRSSAAWVPRDHGEILGGCLTCWSR